MADPVLGYDDEELVAVVVDERNWKGIGISLLVIAAIFSFIGLAIFIMTPKETENDWGRFRVNLTDLLGTHLKPKYFNSSWISGHELVYQNRHGSILLYNAVKNMTSRTLIPSSRISHYVVHNFELSVDSKFVLLEVGRKEINGTEDIQYDLYNVTNANLISLRSVISTFLQSKTHLLNYATWSNHGNSLIFVADNDIYYCSDLESKPIRLTESGKQGVIYNGIPNWYYREFIGLKKALWQCKGEKMILYAVFDDSLVDFNAIKIYGNIYDTTMKFSSGPSIITRRFPKAGRKIPEVSLWVANLNDPISSKRKLREPDTLIGRDKYLAHVHWISKDEVNIIWTLRDHNHSVMLYCSNSMQWSCKQTSLISDSIIRTKNIQNIIISDRNQPSSSPSPPSSSKHFIILPKPDIKLGVHYHIAFYDPKQTYPNSIGNFITHGKYDVTNLLAYDSDQQIIYFQATGLNGRTHRRHIYSARTQSYHETSPSLVCHTCKLDPNCGYYDAIFSDNIEYYVLRCLGPRKIIAEIRATSNHSKIFNIDENKDFHAALMDKRMPQETFLSLPIDNDSRKLNIKVLIPPPRRHLEVLREDEEEEEIIKYPLIIESFPMIDGSITEKYDLHWGHYLSSSKEFLYAQLEIQESPTIDGLPGTAHPINSINNGRDSLWSKINYDHQIAIVDLLDKVLGNVDRRRIAIWGSTSAAFTALTTLAQDKESTISCAIAFSPIINWRLMDAFTAEYLFGDPIAHEYTSNYELNNLILKADHLTEKRFLVVHGTADDVVHIQHTMLFTRACIKEATDGNLNYQIQLYPDEDHKLSRSKLHFLKLADNFLQKCFLAALAQES
ncbi:A-type potassium channel modulatory protein DPP6-like isoform X2 [Brevipalpus obovatus]|uniref:A-type potassium channel modulatory protein DPP6-like isoform X2 n=1 Tax=Brevipalpus obovatus TaxID=246614 RepID=UPI003D9F0832